MNIISYWQNPVIAHETKDRDFYVIYGLYNHLNQQDKPSKCLGLHWDDYPKSRNVLAPMVVPAEVRDSILYGLLKDATDGRNGVDLNKIIEAIEYFKE